MFSSDDNHNSNSRADDDANQNLAKIDANLSAESIEIRKQQIASVFIKLIAMGLTLGVILGCGAYYLLHKFGLTTKPNQLQQERIELQKPLKQTFEEIKAVPAIPSQSIKS